MDSFCWDTSVPISCKCTNTPLVIQQSPLALSFFLVSFCRCLRVNKIISAKIRVIQPWLRGGGHEQSFEENSCKEDLSPQLPVFFGFQSFKPPMSIRCVVAGLESLRREEASSKLTASQKLLKRQAIESRR